MVTKAKLKMSRDVLFASMSLDSNETDDFSPSPIVSPITSRDSSLERDAGSAYISPAPPEAGEASLSKPESGGEDADDEWDEEEMELLTQKSNKEDLGRRKGMVAKMRIIFFLEGFSYSIYLPFFVLYAKETIGLSAGQVVSTPSLRAPPSDSRLQLTRPSLCLSVMHPRV